MKDVFPTNQTRQDKTNVLLSTNDVQYFNEGNKITCFSAEPLCLGIHPPSVAPVTRSSLLLRAGFIEVSVTGLQLETAAL